MDYASQHRVTSLNLDKAFSDLSPNESYYLLNHTVLLSVHSMKGNNTGLGKPYPANYLACEIQQPAGEVYTVGSYRSPLTREIYSWHINSNGVHYILRTKESGCEIVYQLGCLDLSAEPRNSIENWRAFFHIEKICANRHGKYLGWTNGIGNIHFLDVEASIATNFFTTPFFQRCADECALINLCVPDPCTCLKATWIPFSSTDIPFNNFMLDQPFQFIYKHVYYDNRESEWSTPSSTYYQATKGCDILTGFSRCIKLRVPVGNPLVDRIKIGFTIGQNIWWQTEVVEKYKKYNNSQEKWYDRSLAPLDNYSDSDCSFDYTFCNDRQKIQIAPTEISRVYNPIPRDVQLVIPIKDSYAAVNYVQGNCPLDKKEIEKFNVGIDCTQQASNCITEYATVKVRAIISATFFKSNGFVFREGPFGDADDPEEDVYFGTLSKNDSFSYGQQFNIKKRNFIAYVEGTGHWSVMKQWEALNGFTGNNEVGVIAIADNDVGVALHSNGHSAGGKFYYQEAIIKVPKGTRGFIRLTSHTALDGAGNSQDTSTYVAGTMNINYYQPGQDVFSVMNDKEKEVYFDTCNGDVELLEALVIQDHSSFGPDGKAGDGYVSDADDKPVEGVEIYTDPSIRHGSTDHNGFYHFSRDNLTDYSIGFLVEQTCNPYFSQIDFIFDAQGNARETRHLDYSISQDSFNDNFYAEVAVPVKDCDGDPVSGVRVAISGSKYKVTDFGGVAHFKLRNYVDRDRPITAVVMNGNGCYVADCNNNCQPCMPQASTQLPVCFDGNPSLTLSDLVINTDIVFNNTNGLKSGGRYEWALVVKGSCGRISAAYPIKYMDIPKTQEKGFLGFCSFSYNATGMVLPEWAECVQILRSKNINNFELQWKVDKIERTGDGKIKITFQSLHDYNSQHGFKTNTTYQWVDGDRIEFIFNGDGELFTTALGNGLLNYRILNPFHDVVISGNEDADTNFFNQLLLQDDGRLEDLKEGAIIELQRPIAATDQPVYYSICAQLDVENGQLLQPIGTFTSFDTYFVNRVIPSETGTFAGTFEHHSPSDFWGERVSDAGKGYFANAFENEKRFGRYMSIGSASNLSSFGDLVKRFDAQGQGDIVAMDIKDDKIILAICENDNFLAQTSDELVRVGSDGIIRALPPDQRVSDPQAKPFGAYGCGYDDIGSIFFGDGYASYYDAGSKTHVVHDYNAARSFSMERAETYFRIRGQQKSAHNLSQTNPYDKYRWVTGMNYTNGEMFLTLKKLRDSSINNQIAPFLQSNDTICFHPTINYYCGFASFTPEHYSQLDLEDADGCAFVTFSNGRPFVHPVLSTKFNEFYGVACDEVIVYAINQYQQKEKIALSWEMQSEKMWFAKEVTTSYPNFISEVPPIRVKKDNGKWNAGFLFNKNSRAGLYGNTKERVAEPPRGKYILVTMVKDNTDQLKYGTIDNAKRTEYNELNYTFFKFQLVEQSGFTENL